MSVAAFDTLKLARTLRDQAKFTPEQAEGLVEALAEASPDDIATKADLRHQIAALRADIEAARYETLRWIATTLIVLQTAVMFGLLIRGL